MLVREMLCRYKKTGREGRASQRLRGSSLGTNVIKTTTAMTQFVVDGVREKNAVMASELWRESAFSEPRMYRTHASNSLIILLRQRSVKAYEKEPLSCTKSLATNRASV